MEFQITAMAKYKAKKIRMKYEKKWRVLRILSVISLSAAVVSFCIGIFGVPYEEYTISGICGVIFSITFIIFIMVRAILSNLTSHWITTRLNERILKSFQQQ